jgi:UDP-N-acetylmuramoylalanine--D-glutamate ligase
VYASDSATTASVREAVEELTALGATVDAGRHDLDRIRAAAAVIASPGVPPEAPPLNAARDAGVTVLAELDLGIIALPATRFIVVTGTNGKTTTTALAAHLLQAAGRHAEAAGNIGRPLTDLAADATPAEWAVVEASSFQLHDAPHLDPAVGVLTNVSADHLDRYATVEAYLADKRLLFRNADAESLWVLNRDDSASRALAEGVPGRRAYFSLSERSDAWFDRSTETLWLRDEPLVERRAFPLLGDHNVANALAAALAAALVGIEVKDIRRGLASFRAIEHRLEPVAERRGVTWINDSKATNVAAAEVALRAMERPYVLILGGRHKGTPYGVLAPLLGGCRGVVAYGEAAPIVERDLKGHVRVEHIEPFDDAVRRAAALAQPGDVLLLSPACASYDQFHDYEERGRRFRQLAQE